VLALAAGSGATPVSLPPGFPGSMLVWQSAALDNSFAGFVLSNARILVVQ